MFLVPNTILCIVPLSMSYYLTKFTFLYTRCYPVKIIFLIGHISPQMVTRNIPTGQYQSFFSLMVDLTEEGFFRSMIIPSRSYCTQTSLFTLSHSPNTDELNKILQNCPSNCWLLIFNLTDEVVLIRA